MIIIPSKIERGVNFPTFDTLEKIMDVLGVMPNELLSGEWKYVNQSEKEVCQFLRIEEVKAISIEKSVNNTPTTVNLTGILLER